MLPFIENAKEEIIAKLTTSASGTGNAIEQLKEAFQSWQVPWTKARAEKLDQIDSLAKEATVTAGKKELHKEHEALTALIGKRADKIDGVLDTKSSQESVSQLLVVCKDIIAPRVAGNLLGKQEIYTSPGLHTFAVPSGSTRIRVKASGAGGGGGGGGRGSTGRWNSLRSAGEENFIPGSGGGSGAFLSSYIPVVEGEKIEIVIGAGGDGGNPGELDDYDHEHEPTDGKAGGATIIKTQKGTYTIFGGGEGKHGANTDFRNKKALRKDIWPPGGKGGAVPDANLDASQDTGNKKSAGVDGTGGRIESYVPGMSHNDPRINNNLPGKGGKNGSPAGNGGNGGNQDKPGEKGQHGYVLIEY